MKKYYVIATRVDLGGFPESFSVGYDNSATDDYDSFMFFDTKENAEKWIESAESKGWKNCTFEICEDNND